MVWKKLLKLLNQMPAPKIVVSGLKGEDKFFQESIQEETQAFLDRATKLLDDVEGVTIHVKSSGRGKAKKFELHSLLSLPRTAIHAQASGRKLNFVLQNLFEELLSEARKQKSVRDSSKKGKPKRFSVGLEVG